MYYILYAIYTIYYIKGFKINDLQQIVKTIINYYIVNLILGRSSGKMAT